MAETFSFQGGTLNVTRTGPANAPARLLLLHGWKQPAVSLLPVVKTLNTLAVVGLDTPGNGTAPEPPADWNLQSYVAAVRAFMQSQPPIPTVIVCHSFGCRLAMHLAATQEPWLRGIVVMGGHGLRPIRPLPQRLRVWSITRITKVAGFVDRLFTLGLKTKWAGHFGSADYRSAGAMRDVFVCIIADDVAPLLSRVAVPVLLLYGENDRETPPAMAQKYHDLLPKSDLGGLPGLDHYSILTSPVIATRAKEFITKVLA